MEEKRLITAKFLLATIVVMAIVIAGLFIYIIVTASNSEGNLGQNNNSNIAPMENGVNTNTTNTYTLPTGTNTPYETRSQLIHFFERYNQFVPLNFDSPNEIKGGDIASAFIHTHDKNIALTQAEADNLNVKYNMSSNASIAFGGENGIGIDAAAVRNSIYEATGINYVDKYDATAVERGTWYYVSEYDMYMPATFDVPHRLWKLGDNLHGLTANNFICLYAIDDITKITDNQYKIKLSQYYNILELLEYNNITGINDEYLDTHLTKDNVQAIYKRVINNELSDAERQILNADAYYFEVVIRVLGENNFQFVSSKQLL